MNMDGITKLLNGSYRVCVQIQDGTETDSANTFEEAVSRYKEMHMAYNHNKDHTPSLYIEEQVVQTILRATNKLT